MTAIFPRPIRPSGLLLALVLGALAGCDSGPTESGGDMNALCRLEGELVSGGPGRDAIPALNDPILVRASEPGGDYLLDQERIIGVVHDGVPVAIPHRIGWRHEIVNLVVGGRPVAVTYCPLTGSSLVFERTAVDGADFGVSGLLFKNNLVMFDRTSEESLWAQMSREAGCGPRDGTSLEMVPAMEMKWARWRELHPDTRLPGHLPEQGQHFNAITYPYGDYEELHNDHLLFPMGPLDDRRPPKERVLGIPHLSLAFPFRELDAPGEPAVAQTTLNTTGIAVFWDSEGEAAMALRTTLGERSLSFEVRDGRIVDAETGSTWTIEGLAVEGPLAGERLEPVAEAHVAFWFAWAAFHPGSAIWTRDGGVTEF